MAPMDLAFREVGRAVFQVQRFEAALTPIYELFKIVTIDGHFERHQGLIPDGAWKLALTALVKELEKKGRIDAEFSARLRAFAVRRHTLIHRWLPQHGWPGNDKGTEAYTALTEFACGVAAEAYELTTTVARYVLACSIGYGDLELTDVFLRAAQLSPEDVRGIEEQLAAVRDELGAEGNGSVPLRVPLVELRSYLDNVKAAP